MKLYHIADLHFGKIIYGKSLLEEQTYWVQQFLALCKENHPDGVMIAGDVYDRSQPSKEAVELLDHLISSLAEMNIPVMMIAGNHDSGQRLSFGSSILSQCHVHIVGTLTDSKIPHVTYTDAYGPVNFYMLPYVFPEQVAYVFNDETIRTYQQAMEKLIAFQDIKREERNVLIAHQNVVMDGKEVERGGSESMVGGVGQIEHTVFEPFDYVALGHIHSSYPVGKDTIRYAGTPLCYHFDEIRQKDKGLLEITLKEKGNISIQKIVITPLHPLVAFVDTKQNILKSLQEQPLCDSLVSITLSDAKVDASSYGLFRSILMDHNSLLLEMTSTYHRFEGQVSSLQSDASARSVEELFSDLYIEQSAGIPPTQMESAFMEETARLLSDLDMDDQDLSKRVDALLAWIAKEVRE